MNEILEPIEGHFRTNLAVGLEPNPNAVDRENKIIHGFAVMTKGFVKDSRGWEIDDATLQQVVDAGNVAKGGIKSRFGHPNMSGEAFGTMVGRAKNFRMDGNVARADLHISDAAFTSPNGDLGTYVLDMADKEPDMFGASIVLDEAGFEYRKNQDGSRKQDDKGQDLPPLLRVKSISAADVVDSPAANDGMFGRKFFNSSLTLSVEATEFLNKFLKNPSAVERVQDFLARYGRTRDLFNEHHEEEMAMTNETKPEVLTLEGLKTERPDLIEKISVELSKGHEDVLKKSVSEALSDQKTRLLELFKLSENPEFSSPANRAIIMAGIEKDEAFAIVQQKLYDSRLAELKREAPKGAGAGEIQDQGDLSTLPDGEEKWKAQFEQSPQLQKEFRSKLSTYLAYMKAQARGQVTLLTKSK